MGNPSNTISEEPRDLGGFAAGEDESAQELGGFTTTPRVIPISLLAILIGGIASAGDIVRPNPATAFPDEPQRAVVNRMAETGITRLLVVAREDPPKLVGIISLNDLLVARVRNLEDERRSERVLTMHRTLPIGLGRPPAGLQSPPICSSC